MSATSPRWVDICTGCHKPGRELESRERHAMRALCDDCAELPPLIDITTPPARVRGAARHIEVALSAAGLARFLYAYDDMPGVVLALTLDHNRVRCWPPIPDADVAS